jgi:hypothetical protein
VVAIIIVIYIVGLIVSTFVFKKRAGLPVMRNLRVFGRDGVGLGFLMLSVGKSMIWPIVLVVWIATGRPAPRTRFLEPDPGAA